MIQCFLCYDPTAEIRVEGKSMQKRKRIRYFLLAVIVVLSCAMSACRCEPNLDILPEQQESQYFL